MSLITTGSHPKSLWPGIHAHWGRSYNEQPDFAQVLFDVRSSDKAYEETVEVTGFGIAPVKPEGSSTAYDTETQQVVTRFTHIAYSLGYKVSKEAIDDNLYEYVSKRRVAANAFSMKTTRNTVAANVYNRAFNSTYTFGDGKEILATDHPTLSGNQSNELTTAADLSEASAEDLITNIWNAKNARGLRISLQPQKLCVAPSNYWNAKRIFDSEQRSGSADNDINVLRNIGALPGGIEVVPFFSDADAWFISTNAPEGMICFERNPVEFSQDNDFDTDNLKAKAYMRMSFGVADWRALYGSPGV